MIIVGKHPFHRGKDSIRKYAKRLKTSNITFPQGVSEYCYYTFRLAKDLIMRLCSVNVELRYSAKMALNHPWITRKFESSIPLTIYEEGLRKNMCDNLNEAFKAIIFMVLCSQSVY